MYELYCKRDPKKLGIALPDGSWDVDRFQKHCYSCDVCRKYVHDFKKELKKILAIKEGGRK